MGCAQLALEGPQTGTEAPASYWTPSEIFNTFSLCCFILELIGKAVAHGFIARTELRREAYLQDPLNWIDFIIVVLLCASHMPVLLGALGGATWDFENVSIHLFFPQQVYFAFLYTPSTHKAWFLLTAGGAASVGGWGRTLRALRVLQSLRMFGRNSRLRIILNALMNSIPGASAVLMLLLIFTYIYAVIGVELFAGAFKRCCVCDKEIDIVYARNLCHCHLIKSLTDIHFMS